MMHAQGTIAKTLFWDWQSLQPSRVVFPVDESVMSDLEPQTIGRASDQGGLREVVPDRESGLKVLPWSGSAAV